MTIDSRSTGTGACIIIWAALPAARGPLTNDTADPRSTRPTPPAAPPPAGPPPGASTGSPAPPRPPFWRKPKNLALLALVAIVVAIGLGSVVGYALTFDIPEVKHLQDWKPPVVTTSYGADGQVLYQFGAEKRIVVQLDQISKSFIDALVATEDSNFYDHVGIDPWGIGRAIITDIVRLKKAQGGSTITQQLARSLFLKTEKTMRRKLQEMVLALQIEKAF